MPTANHSNAWSDSVSSWVITCNWYLQHPGHLSEAMHKSCSCLRWRDNCSHEVSCWYSRAHLTQHGTQNLLPTCPCMPQSIDYRQVLNPGLNMRVLYITNGSYNIHNEMKVWLLCTLLLMKDSVWNHNMGSLVDGSPPQSEDLIVIVRSKTICAIIVRRPLKW